MGKFYHPYEVLEVVKSESNPDKTYEIRKSKQDGKTYCTCPGWIFKARKGNGICKHIAAYLERGNRVDVYTAAEFEAACSVHRAIKLD